MNTYGYTPKRFRARAKAGQAFRNALLSGGVFTRPKGKRGRRWAYWSNLTERWHLKEDAEGRL